jgi:hypothetical protein
VQADASNDNRDEHCLKKKQICCAVRGRNSGSFRFGLSQVKDAGSRLG